MELWDAYLPDGQKAGQTLLRSEPVPAGLYHIVADVLVKHADGDYLVVQRDYRKQLFPGLFEAGASGCVVQGEIPRDGALRELREETGLRTDSLTFMFATSNLQDTIYVGYLCITDCEKDDIILQEGETIGYRWLNERDFFAFLQTDSFAKGQKQRWMPYLYAVARFGMSD